VAGAIDEDVLGFDVAMDDPRAMRRRDPAPGGDEALEDLARRSRLGQPRGERRALDQLHRDVRAVTVAAGVVDRDDVGMRELRERAAFAHEPLDAEVQLGVDQLDRDRAIELRIVTGVDRAHAAVAEPAA